MDNPNPPRPGNPLLVPPDQVLRAITNLETLSDFQVVVSWVGACYAYNVNRGPNIKDDVDNRWNQGQCQALLMINKALTQARPELNAREEIKKENALPRNV